MNPIAIVILETMWGPADGFRKLFPINQDNHSGRRLYRLFSSYPYPFLVGNACPGIVSRATEHSKPCPIHLASVFDYAGQRNFTPRLIVFGGKVAADTYDRLEVKPNVRALFIPHPAARFWTREMDTQAQDGIDNGLDQMTLGRDGWAPRISSPIR